MNINPNDLPAHIKAINPHLFDVGRVEGSKPKPDQRSEGENPKLVSGSEGFRVCVTLVRFGRRALDAHDNLRSSLKPLVDAITEYLGFSNDADPRLHWEYGQAGTTGAQGVLVKVELTAKGDREPRIVEL